jgi:hypothetical protein
MIKWSYNLNTNRAKDLFQLQSELIDMKVDMAAGKAIDRVIEKINDLKYEMHTDMHKLRHDMNHGFSSLDKRVVAIETRLGMNDEKQKGIYNRTMDYLFKAGYGVLTFAIGYVIYVVLNLHPFIK